jgi:hypothetical protein
MIYVVSILVENHNRERLRAFVEEGPARRYVERLGERLNRRSDTGRSRLFVASATLYGVLYFGKLRQLATFDGHDRGDGLWHGWDDGLSARIFDTDY